MVNETIEYVTLADPETHQITGQFTSREQVSDQDCVVVVGLLLILIAENRQPKLILSQRSFKKKVLPGIWSLAVAGHMVHHWESKKHWEGVEDDLKQIPGDSTPQDAMMREINEELGEDFSKSLDKSQLVEVLRTIQTITNSSKTQLMIYYAITITAEQFAKIIFDPSEIASIQKFTQNELDENTEVLHPCGQVAYGTARGHVNPMHKEAYQLAFQKDYGRRQDFTY